LAHGQGIDLETAVMVVVFALVSYIITSLLSFISSEKAIKVWKKKINMSA